MARVAIELARGRWGDERLVRASRMNELMKDA